MRREKAGEEKVGEGWRRLEKRSGMRESWMREGWMREVGGEKWEERKVFENLWEEKDGGVCGNSV